MDLKTFFKPTNSFLYLHRNSCHNKHVFQGFIKGEAIRHIRNTNNENDLHEILAHFKLNLISRGYNDPEITEQINQALSSSRSYHTEKRENKKNKEIPLCLVTRFNPCIRKLKQAILKHWNILANDEVCKNIFKEKPIISFKRHKNLSDILTSTKIK